MLRPYPEFCDINEVDDPAGGWHYNALDLNYTHRVSRGLTLLASYTFSKFLDNVGGPNTWANANANFSENIRNVYNLAAEKSVDAADITHSFVLSYVYELPVGMGRKFGAGMNKVVNGIVGDWQTSGIVTLKGGFPLTITSSAMGLITSARASTWTSLATSTPPDQGISQWFNPAAFAVAQPWSLGNAPRYFSDLRSPDYKNVGSEYSKVFPSSRKRAFPVPPGYVQRFQSR